MREFLNSILKVPALVSSARLVKHFKFPIFRKAVANQKRENSVGTDLQALNCRVRLTKQQKEESVFDVFTVEICGSIHAPGDMHSAIVRILIMDVTDGISKARPVRSRVEQRQVWGSPAFCYEAELGRIPDADITISDWMAVARLRLDWLKFPRKGKRNVQFATSILSGRNGEELAHATYTIAYENSAFGYIDLQENIRQAKTLAVALAFAVSAADGKLYNCEIETIKSWAGANIDFSKASNNTKHKLEKALNRTAEFFCDGNQLDVHRVCKEIAEFAPLAVRYDILDLCLHVAGANGVVTAEELGLLKNLADWLEVDTDRFREMMGKILPVGMHEVKDLELMLGLSSDMSRNETRQRLNREYRKWNARVTNSDPEIRMQADSMLDFIAKARTEYVA